MRQQAKNRLLGLTLLVFFVAVTAYNWHLLVTSGRFYLRASGLAPVGALLGLVFLVFPSMAGKPNTLSKKGKILLAVVAIVGLVLGGINFYLMDNYRREPVGAGASRGSALHQTGRQE